MSASTSTLSSAQSFSSSMEQEDIVTHFQELGCNFLGNAEFDKDFFAVPDGRDAKNVKYEISEGVPFLFHVYGMLLPQEKGSKINAAGNYNGGEAAYFRPLRDGGDMGRHVKDVHAIAVPPWSIPKMKAQINNSIATLNAVDEGVKRSDEAKGLKPPVATYDWVKSSNGEDVDIILINSPNKYGKPSANENISSTAVRKTSKVDIDEPDCRNNDSETNVQAKRVGKTGAWYDPNIQPDFGGSFFDIHNDKLKQQEIYDPDGDLIHPRDMYNVLRPGTLIEYICHLHVFNIVNRNSKTPGSNRYYQIQFDEAHILLESDEPPCLRTRPDVPVEYAALLNNTAPRPTGRRVQELQTYSQKKRAIQRLKTTPTVKPTTSNTSGSSSRLDQKEPQPTTTSTSGSNSTPAAKPSTNRTRNQAASDKAKGKRKEAPDAEDDMNCD